MSTGLERLRNRRGVNWRTVLGLLLVPVTAAGVLLWGLWNPTERLDSVTAAVVNLDEPVTVDGQLVPMGRVLAAELIGSSGAGSTEANSGSDSAGTGAEDSVDDADDALTNFTWLLTDESDAAAGLKDGRYATVVTIPSNFSAAAMSFSQAAQGDGQAETATIEIETSERGRLLDSALSNIVTSTATSVLNQQLGAQFVGGVFVGMTELGAGIGDAADGAAQLAEAGGTLADGTSELADGTVQLADGTQQLASGATQLASGVHELSNGAGELSNGAAQLSSGMNEFSGGVSELAEGAAPLAGGAGALAAGATELVDGTAQLSAGASGLSDGAAGLSAGATSLADGTSQLAGGVQLLASGDGTESNPGLAGLAGGVEAYVGAVDQALDGAQQGLAGVSQLISASLEPVTQLRDLVQAGVIPVENPDATVEGLNTLIAQMQAALDADASLPITEMKEAGAALVSGTQASAAGAAELAAAADALAGGAGDLAGGATELAGGASQLAEGNAALAASTPGLAAGAQQLADGSAQLVGGATALAEGSQQLAGGAAGLAGGTSELAGGTAQLADGASQLALGTTELAAQTPQLADGATQLADGTREFVDGTATLADGLGEAAANIPSYTDAEAEHMAEVAVAPVAAEGGADELFNASGVPLFAGIALWAGAFASFLVLAPLWRRTREAARGVGYVTLRSVLPALSIGALQGVIVGIILPILLDYDFGQSASFFGLAVLAGAAFSLVNQGLSALFGGFGRFLAFALLVVAFAIGVISTAPPVLQAIGDGSPVGALFDGFQAVAMGAVGVGSAAFALVLWGIAGWVLTALSVARERRTLNA